MTFTKLIFLLTTLFAAELYALPIDWNGSIGFDNNIITNARRTGDDCPSPGTGSYCINDDNNNARYQSFILKLNPTIVINDSASIKGEISTGRLRGGFAGEDTQVENGSYYSQSTSGTQTLTANQLYVELYADTALYRFGKYAKGFGLGGFINKGENTWDRYFSVYDGFEAEFKLGKLTLTPIYSRLASPTNGPDGTDTAAEDRYTGRYDTIETAISGVYIDPNKNFEFGIYYGIRETETNSELYGTGSGPNNVTLIDVYFKKSWESFGIALEVPMLSGDVGTTYGTTNEEDIDTNAFIFESYYEMNSKWRLGLDAGSVKGEDGTEEFNGMYLHPNFRIAEVMFRYNLAGFQNKNQNIFNSSINNTNYAKLYTRYQSDEWTWNIAVIMATANEVAKTGDSFYNHETNTFATANADQEDDLGMEFDISFDYQWNPNIYVSGFIGYYQVGEFYEFTNNSAETISVEDITASGFRISLDF